MDFDINKTDFVFMDDELPANSAMEMGTNTSSNVSVVSFQSVRSNSTKTHVHKLDEMNDDKIDLPECIDEGNENEVMDIAGM